MPGSLSFRLVVALCVCGFTVGGCGAGSGVATSSATAPVSAVGPVIEPSSAGSTAPGSTTPNTAPWGTDSNGHVGTTKAQTNSFTADQQLVADRYMAAMAAYDEAGAIPDPNYQGLKDTMVDPGLQQTRLDIANWKSVGYASKYPTPSIHANTITAVVITGSSSSVSVCAVNDGIVYVEATGQVINDKIVTRKLVATMQLVDGAWKLAEQKTVDNKAGVVACAN